MKILFLGYDRTETCLINELEEFGCEVSHYNGPLSSYSSNPHACLHPICAEMVISFGFRHKIPCGLTAAPIINLHTSLLPYNRGAHPNFWAHYDGTPHGVTIHEVDEGIDTGKVLFTREIMFDRGEVTFAETYERLHDEMEQLFIDNVESIIDGKYVPRPQLGRSSSHVKDDLPTDFAGWDSAIAHEVPRLKRQICATQLRDSKLLQSHGGGFAPAREKREGVNLPNYNIKPPTFDIQTNSKTESVFAADFKMGLIDSIEQVRSENNVNWMDVLRLAFREAPEEAKGLVRKINESDGKISELLGRLGE